MKQATVLILLFGFITKSFSFSCYHCTSVGNFSNSTCVGSKLDSSLLIQCPPMNEHCAVLTTIDLNTNETTSVVRKCVPLNVSTCIDTPLGLSCVSTCDTERCNDWDSSYLKSSADLTFKCHVCSSSSEPGCRDVGNNNTFLKNCSPGQKYCSVTTVTSSDGDIDVIRSCSSLGQASFAIVPDRTLCAASCESEGCNDFNNCRNRSGLNIDESSCNILPSAELTIANHTENGLKCFVCDSLVDSACKQDSLPSSFLQNCSDVERFCSKTSRSLPDGNGQWVEIVQRSCSAQYHNNFVVHNALINCVESCDSDGCNGRFTNETTVSIMPPTGTSEPSTNPVAPNSNEHSTKMPDVAKGHTEAGNSLETNEGGGGGGGGCTGLISSQLNTRVALIFFLYMLFSQFI
ncbi:unnamed protein product [Clavelina lepadiformis]|uniref:Uncharacterized protein n=1 Tax=Clavelina lepadiformis TaxID=159417 RepID=A0ABP0FT32_CLALP